MRTYHGDQLARFITLPFCLPTHIIHERFHCNRLSACGTHRQADTPLRQASLNRITELIRKEWTMRL